MENKHIILILIVVIAVLAIAIGVMLMPTTDAKQPSKLKITSDKSQYEGDQLKIMLTDLNKTPISKEIVNITITNKKGKVVVDDVVKTNKNGRAKLDLHLKKGKYVVKVSYDGNDNFTGDNATQKLKIKKEKVVEATVDESSSAGGSGTHTIMGEDGYYYTVDDNGNIKDNLGPSSKYYPNNPNSVDYPDAEPSSKYIDKSK